MVKKTKYLHWNYMWHLLFIYTQEVVMHEFTFYASLGFNILKKFSGNKEEILVNFWLYFCMVCIYLWPKFHHYIRWEFKCHSKRCITLNHCRSMLSPLFLQPWLLNCPKTHCDWLIVLFMYNSYLNCVLHWNNTDRQTVSP